MYQTAGYLFDWFIVDNNSKKETTEWLERVGGIEKDRKIQIQYNNKNFGISKASNQALEMIGKDYDLILKVDNDCLFLSNNWLKDIVDLYERQKRIIVAPRVEGLRDNPGGVPREGYFYIGNHFLGSAPHLGGICIVAPKEVYKDFRWEEDDFLHGEQDYIFSQYALSQGHMLTYLENHIVEHMEGTSVQEKRYPEYFEQRKKLKMTRYEGTMPKDKEIY